MTTIDYVFVARGGFLQNIFAIADLLYMKTKLELPLECNATWFHFQSPPHS